MSITLKFQSSAGDYEVSKGPYSSVRLEGESIRAHPSGAAIASHLPHGWIVDGKEYLRVDSESPVAVLWHNSPPGGTPAMTGHFSSVDGVAFIDRRILGFVDRERNDWYLLRQGHHTPAIVLDPIKA